MNDQNPDSEKAATAINVQRLQTGYFNHLESLRSQIPVGNYLVSPETQRWALISMTAVSIAFLLLFPYTMFIQFTPVVILLYMAAFVGFCWIFYNRVIEPNEGIEEWRE